MVISWSVAHPGKRPAPRAGEQILFLPAAGAADGSSGALHTRLEMVDSLTDSSGLFTVPAELPRIQC
jgi:hypothetical protein